MVTCIVDEDMEWAFVLENQLCCVVILSPLLHAPVEVSTECLFSPRAFGRISNRGKSRGRAILFRLGGQIKYKGPMATHTMSKDRLPGGVLEVGLTKHIIVYRKSMTNDR